MGNVHPEARLLRHKYIQKSFLSAFEKKEKHAAVSLSFKRIQMSVLQVGL